MGWRLRRSVGFGPLRINLSQSGFGCSTGVRGLRVGRDGRGRVYSAVSIPATGIYRRDYYSNKVVLTQPRRFGAKPAAVVTRVSLYVAGAALLYLFIRAMAQVF